MAFLSALVRKMLEMRGMLQVGGKKEKSNRREITEKGSKVGRRNIKSSGRLVFCDKSRLPDSFLGSKFFG
jgi:hypothetical protein